MNHAESFRREMIDALRRELVGPDLPPHGAELNEGESWAEVLQESPIQRYSAGVLFPQNQPGNEVENADESEASTNEANDDAGEMPDDITSEQENAPTDAKGASDNLADVYDETIRMANEFLPSAIGLTFITDFPPNGLKIHVTAARYESRPPTDPKRKLREWHRIPLDISPVTLAFPETVWHDTQEISLGIPRLALRAFYRRRDDDTFLVTVTLLNQTLASSDKRPSGADCFFQTGFNIREPDNRFVFREYRMVRRESTGNQNDPDVREMAALELLYRNRRDYAAAHGCAADWGEESDARTNLIRTSTVPEVKVPPIEPRTTGGDELSMYCLSGAEGDIPPDQIPELLGNLADDYESWIRDRETDLATLALPPDLQRSGEENLAYCRRCLTRILNGIDLLRSNHVLRSAFMLVNRAILMQQYHTRRKKRSVSDPWGDLPTSYRPQNEKSGRWRAFQLAFLLMNLPSIAPNEIGEDHEDRDLVDLIWSPTGGGKTEAYLGLAACDIFFRRLTRPTNAGCTVLMRYTLRLLTSQQFQRAASMISACEFIRRDDSESLGEEPISIGLWVGESLTPTYRADAVKAANALSGNRGENSNPFQLLKCPWCGTALDNRKTPGYLPDGRPKTVIYVCPDRRCPFSSRSNKLPVSVIDEDLYDTPPTLIIGTVDKFAMLAWREQAGRLFGLGTDTGFDPPDLIIQDELHLISGPLGSVVGLYESAIDLLCSWKGRRPKIVASTATIRRAWHQCQALYDRPTFQFPPQGLDISDSFFAKENPDAPGRIYVGVFGSASPSFITTQVRTIGGLLQSCQSLPLPDGASEATRDPYWTVLEYFNSLRELGHAATLVEADIPEYMWAIASRSRLPRELCRRLGTPVELTSRRTADEIPSILERLEVRYPRESTEDVRPLDTLLATNMISVGMDIDRLGLMVMIGQPKTTSEYIQASSRVGRTAAAPGLVVIMYNPGKPRDRSHYEHFRAYHRSFYKYVEPTSVSLFSRQRTLRVLHRPNLTLAG